MTTNGYYCYMHITKQTTVSDMTAFFVAWKWWEHEDKCIVYILGSKVINYYLQDFIVNNI